MSIFSSAAEALSKVRGLRSEAGALRSAYGAATTWGDVASAPMKHGTSTRWAADRVMPITTDVASRHNLYGPGLYMTGSGPMAREYTEKGIERTSGTMYGFKWKQKPNLIDLDKPLPGKVLKHFQDVEGEMWGPGKSSITSDLLGRDAFKLAVGDGSQTFDMEHSLVNRLSQAGYHGFRHEGGHVVGRGRNLHPVNIAFKPEQDLLMIGKRDVELENLTRKASYQRGLLGRMSRPDPGMKDLKTQTDVLLRAQNDYPMEAKKIWEASTYDDAQGYFVPNTPTPAEYDKLRQMVHGGIQKEYSALQGEIRPRQRANVYQNVAQSKEVRAARVEAQARQLSASINTRNPTSGRMGGVPSRSSR